MTDKPQPTQASQLTLEDIGQLLQEERERNGLSRTDVSTKTKITIEQINNLEEGRAPQIASVYARGFLRTYCELLNFDPEQNDRIQKSYRSLTSGQDVDLGKPSSRRDNRPVTERGSGSPGAWVLALVVLAAAALALWRSPDLRATLLGHLPWGERETAEAAPSPAPPAGGPAVAAAAPSPAAGQASADTGGPAVLFQEPLPASGNGSYSGRLTLRAERGTWAQVTVDAERTTHILFEPGQSQSFEGLDTLSVIAGDGQALIMEWNGQDRGYLGREGPVEVYFTLTKTGADARAEAGTGPGAGPPVEN
ncbi:MAG: DUF4115 domain-containing protein [Deltaproteobacteria bacterium]|nr:DUF4115 domain-containing protein [Deltaproteobacteria bacterium]